MLKYTRKILSFICAFIFFASAIVGTTYAWDNEQQVLNDLSGEKTKFIDVELLKLEKQPDGTKTEIPISNTEFYLFKEDNTQIGGRYLTNENGKINLSLSEGNYYFEEINPSIGYTYDKDEKGNLITKYAFAVSDDVEIVTVKAYNIRLDSSLVVKKTIENKNNLPLLEMQKKTPFRFKVLFSKNGEYTYRIDNGAEKKIKSGEEIILCHGQSAIFENLPIGLQYTVTEVPVEGYICTSVGNQGTITQQQAVANFVNTCDINDLGLVTISKMVIGEGADREKEFTFTAKFGVVVEKFTLKHGEEKTFLGLPVGTEYTITEDDYLKDGYVAEIKEYKGKVLNTERLIIPYKNNYTDDIQNKTGSLEISKEVKGENADLSKEFKFTVTFSGENAPKVQTFTLKHGQSVVINDIPQGVGYTVKETDNGGYKPEFEIASGIITADVHTKVHFVNNVPDTPPPDEKVTLTVTKKLAGEFLDSDLQREFSFTLTVNGNVTEFTLKADETKEFEIPKGAVYQLEEADYISEGFAQSIVNGYGTADKPVDITVTNTYIGTPMVEIKGQKTWVMGKHTDVTLPQSITIRLKNGDFLVEERTIKPDNKGVWEYTFKAPKYNPDGSVANYSVEELPVESYETTYDGYNIVNTYVAPIQVEMPVITKNIDGDNAPKTQFEFELKGQNSAPMPTDSQGNKKTIIIDGAGQVEVGKITFTDSGEYIYTLSEINYGIKGWKYDPSVYTIIISVSKSENVLSYKKTIIKDDNETDNVVFTNIFNESDYKNTTIIKGTKTWVHGDNPEKYQPESITVLVYGDDQLVAQRKVTVKDNWNYSFELPKTTKTGQKINYTVSEEPVSNYKITVDGYNITNTYIAPDNDYQGDDYHYPDDTTQTGDKNDMTICVVLMVLSLVGFVITTFLGRKKKY